MKHTRRSNPFRDGLLPLPQLRLEAQADELQVVLARSCCCRRRRRLSAVEAIVAVRTNASPRLPAAPVELVDVGRDVLQAHEPDERAVLVEGGGVVVTAGGRLLPPLL